MKDNMDGRWSHAEWLKVAAMALGLIERGAPVKEALKASQVAVLPRHRWREPEKLAHAAAPSMKAWPKYLAEAKALTPEQREAVLMADAPPPVKGKAAAAPAPAPDPAPVVKEKKKYKARVKAAGTEDKRTEATEGQVVRWTSNEWALIARAAKWVSQQSPNLSLPRQVNEAQAWTLQPHRLRPYNAIAQSYHTRQDGQRILVRKLAEGLERGWTINTVPFNPPGSEPEKTAVAEAIEELAPPPVVADPPDLITPVSDPSRPSTGGALPSSSLTEAAQAFGMTMMTALESLLQTQAQHLLGQVNDRIGTMAHDMGLQVAGMIESAMRRTVHSMVEQELGGPVSPPAPPANEPASVESVPVIPGEVPQRKRVKIDVVGVPHGVMLHEIQRAIDEQVVDVRFVHPDASYAPHGGRHVIMIQQKISHSLSAKIKAAKIKPIFVPRATAGHVTHAIEELQRSAMQ